jgi:hypothetical protein
MKIPGCTLRSEPGLIGLSFIIGHKAHLLNSNPTQRERETREQRKGRTQKVAALGDVSISNSLYGSATEGVLWGYRHGPPRSQSSRVVC